MALKNGAYIAFLMLESLQEILNPLKSSDALVAQVFGLAQKRLYWQRYVLNDKY